MGTDGSDDDLTSSYVCGRAGLRKPGSSVCGRAGRGGYPERFAQQALGHNSKAVHYAYSKRAEVTVPSLDDWEKGWNEKVKPEMPKVEVPILDNIVPLRKLAA